MKSRIYLDYAASTPVAPEVLKVMEPYSTDEFGNPGSLHSFGQRALAAMDKSRETVAKTIGADFREVIFTGSATEANNLALRGVVRAIVSGNQNTSARPAKIIISSIEHESVQETARDLEKDGVEVVYIPVDRNGLVVVKKIKEALDERTVLVSVMYVNNEIGSVQPISEISELIKNWKLKIKNSSGYPLVHTDAAQAFNYFDCDVNKLGVDLMTLSGQKIYGPKGVGALFVKNPKLLSPIITGGGQEFGLRSGTENVPAVVGFAKAIELAWKDRKKNFQDISSLKDYFWRGLKKIYPQAEINGIGNKESGIMVPHILNIYFPTEFAGDLLIKLDIAGVAVSAGSACSARSYIPSYVLQALGLSEERIRGSLRFSFGKITTRAELNDALKIMKGILNS